MLTALVLIFVLAYAAIALEHPLKVNKSASALIGAACSGRFTRCRWATRRWSASNWVNH